MQDLMKKQGLEPVGSTPTAFATLVCGEITKWTNVIKQVGIKRFDAISLLPRRPEDRT